MGDIPGDSNSRQTLGAGSFNTSKLRAPSPLGDSLESNVWATGSTAPAPTVTSTTSAANPISSLPHAAPHVPAVVDHASNATPVDPGIPHRSHSKHHLNSDTIHRVAHMHDASADAVTHAPSSTSTANPADDVKPASKSTWFGKAASGLASSSSSSVPAAAPSSSSSEHHDAAAGIARKHTKGGGAGFATIAQAAIQADRLRAPQLSEGQLAGAERSSSHGRFIGPTQKYRLHDYAIFTRFVQLGACLWLLVGMVMAMTIFVAVTINVSYAAFNASRNVSIWPLIMGLAFYIELGYIFVSSFIRTGVRMQIYIWGANFGNDPDSDIFPIFLIAPFLTNMMEKISGLNKKKDVERQGETDPLLGQRQREPTEDELGDAAGAEASIDDDSFEEVVAERVDLIGHIMYLIILFIVLSLPMGYYTFRHGYWALVNFISIGICISSLLFIVLVNLAARIIRTYNVVHELWSHPEEVSDSELRATFYASTGFDTGKDIVGFIIGRGLWTAIFIFVGALAFSHFTRDSSVIIVSGFFIAVFLIAHIPFIRQIAYTFQKRTFWQPDPNFEKSEGYALYNGAEEWPAFVAFGMRCAVFVIGFSCLLYYDLFWKRREDHSQQGGNALEVGVHRIILFLFIIIGHDVAILLPVIRWSDPAKPWQYTIGNARARVAIMSGLMVLGLSLAFYSYYIRANFSSSVAVVVAFLILSYRHPRCRWTNYQRTFKKKKFSKEARLERRATRNARNTLVVVILVVATSWIVALAIGMVTPEDPNSDKMSWVMNLKPSSLKIPAIGLPEGYEASSALSTKPPKIFKPAVCSVSVTKLIDIDILDVAAMARGSYEPCVGRAGKIIHKRPRLATWATVNTTLPEDCSAPEGNGEGVQWVEYRNVKAAEGEPAISIVAVRGTSNTNDVFQDLYLWSTSALLQLSSFMGTLVTVWPADTVDMFANMIMKFGPLDSTLVYWNEVEKHVDYLKSQNRSVIMTGHSLGGAVASIVASHMEIPSYAFSAPGLGYSTRRYNMTTQNLQKYTMNVVPWHDAVPCFDLQVGLIQTIPCNQNEFLSCHSLDLTIETLKGECEDQ
ncbi:hypothetical protein HDU97_000289 [Phlyctochytrium planicorne]|nr:hypothetical protein HDU97_000289 [Phlyctochytrium planicorne]